ncbi:bL21 family ribosomal protein, partial [[Clostridium] scindens]
MYAVLVTGGKQYKVSEGDVIYVEKINADVDSTVE